MSLFSSGLIAKNDEITYWSAAIAGGLSIYIMTFGGVYVFAGLVSISMLLVGTVFASRLNVQKSEELPSPEELANVGLMSFALLGVFITFTWILNLIYYIPRTQSIAISTWFGIFTFNTSVAWSSSYTAGFIFIVYIIPNAEEQFFRGLWGNGSVALFGPLFGSAAGGAIFAAFHIAADGLDGQVLASIALDGILIISLTITTGRILTGLLAHIGNNAISFLAQGSVLGSVLGPFHFPVQTIIPMVIFGFLIFKQVRLRRMPMTRRQTR